MDTGSQWRIDTLDARGGLAFASWRKIELEDGKISSREPPSIFICAPDFRPEPVANRAIALAAGRGSFQTKLFIDGVEASFPTPASVVEFVRRAYLRSASGDGGGGETPLPLPMDRPDIPRHPDFIEDDIPGQKLRQTILNAIGSFQDISKNLNIGESAEFNEWPPEASRTSHLPVNSFADGPGMLASAALRLIYEMVQRLPFANDPRTLAQWQRDARRLGGLLARLDLWPLLFTDPYRKSLLALTESLLHVNHGIALFDVINKLPFDDRHNIIAVYTLFVDGPDLDDSGDIDWFFECLHYWPMHFQQYFWGSGSQRTLDPISDLIRMPLPHSLEDSLSLELKDGASVYHALAAFMGNPSASKGNQDTVLIDIVLFACSCIVGPDRGQPLSPSIAGGQFWSDRNDISPSRKAGIQTLADNSWNWLREHLPCIVFPEPLENAIESTANLRSSAINVLV